MLFHIFQLKMESNLFKKFCNILAIGSLAKRKITVRFNLLSRFRNILATDLLEEADLILAKLK